jgi:hypothetical protein
MDAGVVTPLPGVQPGFFGVMPPALGGERLEWGGPGGVARMCLAFGDVAQENGPSERLGLANKPKNDKLKRVT